MSILNNDVLVQETPTKLTLEKVLNYVIDKTGINITKYPTVNQLREGDEVLRKDQFQTKVSKHQDVDQLDCVFAQIQLYLPSSYLYS